jgi:hypothetical protein
MVKVSNPRPFAVRTDEDYSAILSSLESRKRPFDLTIRLVAIVRIQITSEAFQRRSLHLKPSPVLASQ